MASKDFTLANVVLAPFGQRFDPLGPLYLTSVLEGNGYHVDFRDYQTNNFHNPYSVKNILGFLHDSSDVLGIGCYFSLLPLVLLSVAELKKENPDKTIVLGGPGPTAVSEEIMKNFPQVDIIVRGEAEETIVELMDTLGKNGDLAEVSGITYRKGDEIQANPARKRIKNLDLIPFPAYDRINFSDYALTGVMSSRGCPYHCTFCEVAPLWDRRNTARSVGNLIDELRLLHDKYKIDYFYFNDDLFTLNRKRVIEFCKALKGEGLDFEWCCLARVDLVDDELMREMSLAGCTGIQYGVESGSDSILKRIGKGFTAGLALDAMSKSVKHFGRVVSTYIWGFPFETLEDFYQTTFLMARAAQLGSQVKLLLLSPTPLSKLYLEYRDTIRFSEDLCPDMVWRGFPNWEQREALKMIRDYPNVFPDFYCYHSDNLVIKRDILAKCGLYL